MEAGSDDQAVAALAPRRKLIRNGLISLTALAAVAVIVALNLEEVVDGLRLLSAADVIALVALHLLALVLRATAWGMCLRAAGSEMPNRELHITSGPRFLADTMIPTYAGAFVRIGLLKVMMGARAPTVGQMITADGVLLLVEAFITVAAILVISIFAGLPWWWAAVIAGGAAIGSLAAWQARRRFAGRPFVRALDILLHRRGAIVLSGILLVVLVVQPVRFWIALNGVGVEASALEAVLAFIATSIIGALPVGPGPASIGATGVVFRGEELGAIAAAGIVLASAAFIAAFIYSAAGAVAAGSGVRSAVRSRLRRETPSR